jgi:O-antigen ligase
MQATTETTPNLLWTMPLALAGFALLAVFGLNPLAGAVALLGLAVVALSFKWPEAATLAVILAIYLNIPAVAVKFHHVPKALAASMLLLLVFPLFDRLMVRKEEIVFDRIAQLMSLYLIAMLVSTIFAKDLTLAAHNMADYVAEGLIIYLLIVNVIRDLPTLKRVVLVLLLAGSLMGGLSIIQNATGTIDKDYGGFAQAGGLMGAGMSWGKQAVQKRAAGPIGEKNRYAQVLVVLLPLAYFMLWHKKRRALRLGAIAVGGLIVGGIALSYSRGAILGIVMVVLLMMAMRYIKIYQVILAGLAVTVIFAIRSPDFAKRMQTLEQVPTLFMGKSTQVQSTDESLRRRWAENLAAFQVFTDHPLAGVGPGHFARYYSTAYVNRLGLAAQAKGYFAHNMYLEVAAETGAFGLLAFLSLLWVLLHGLWAGWRRLRWRYPDLAQLSAALLLSCATYLVTATFLQLSYQRYFWLLVAIASAAMHLIDKEEAERDAMAEEELMAEAERAAT